jgi:hypothetical protein
MHDFRFVAERLSTWRWTPRPTDPSAAPGQFRSRIAPSAPGDRRYRPGTLLTPCLFARLNQIATSCGRDVAIPLRDVLRIGEEGCEGRDMASTRHDDAPRRFESDLAPPAGLRRRLRFHRERPRSGRCRKTDQACPRRRSLLIPAAVVIAAAGLSTTGGGTRGGCRLDRASAAIACVARCAHGRCDLRRAQAKPNGLGDHFTRARREPRRAHLCRSHPHQSAARR